MHTEIVERGCDAALDRAAHCFGNDDSAWRRQRLQPRRNVNAVAVDVAIRALVHVTQVHADAEAQPTIVGNVTRRGVKRALHGERRGDGAGCRFEHRQHGISDGIDDAPVMCGDLLSEHGVGGL